MGPAGAAALGGAIQGIVGTGMGLLLEDHNDKRQIRQQQKLTDMQKVANMDLMDYGMGLQKKMWEETNYDAQKAQMKKAGINPALMYGMGGGGGTTTGSASGSVGGAQAPSGGQEVAMGIQTAMAMKLQQAQIENIEANTAKTNTETNKIATVDTDEAKGRISNNALEGSLKQLGIDQGKIDLWIRQANKWEEMKTNSDELEARQGVAGTIYEMWQEGKLKDKSEAELEALILNNAKTKADTENAKQQLENLKANLKGQNLANMLSEMDVKLSSQYGIVKDSPWYLKTLGNLLNILLKK